MGIFYFILLNQLYKRILFDKRYKLFPSLVRREGCLHKSSFKCPNTARSHTKYENILSIPIGKTFQQTVFSYVHQARRKLLRIHTSSFIINISDCFLILNKSMVSRDYGPSLSWCKWFIFDYGKGIQSISLSNIRIIKTIQGTY